MSARGYAVELRSRVVAAVDQGMTLEEAAEVFTVGVATVYRWTALRRETGSLAPRPHGGGQPRALSPSDDEFVRETLKQKPDLTVAELAARLSIRGDRSVSRSAVTRSLKRLGFTLKKSPHGSGARARGR